MASALRAACIQRRPSLSTRRQNGSKSRLLLGKIYQTRAPIEIDATRGRRGLPLSQYIKVFAAFSLRLADD
jgi:hypothetical protein